MKATFLKFIPAAAVLCLLAGCITLSVYPFYTPKDLVFDPNLTGHWVKVDAANESWQFADVDGRSYLLTAIDDKSTNGLEAHLFRLKDYQFLDLLTTNRADYQMPVHMISKVTHHDSNLTLQFLDYGWLANLIETNPAAVRHVIIPQTPGDTNNGNMIYLTAETKELQKFLLKHADDTNVFGSGSEVDLKRAP